MRNCFTKKKVSVSILLILSLVLCLFLQASAATWSDWHTGYATFTSSGYSGGHAMLDPIPSTMEITALNETDYNSFGVSAALAGAYLEVKSPKGITIVYVTDTYPGSPKGALDICPKSFAKLGDISKGKVDLQWRVIKAPITGNLTYKIKTGSSQYWAAIQVRNHKYPVLKMEYYKNGKWNNMEKQPYNYFLATNMGLGTQTLRMTDIRGKVVIDTMRSLPKQGGDEPEYTVDGRVQFPD